MCHIVSSVVRFSYDLVFVGYSLTGNIEIGPENWGFPTRKLGTERVLCRKFFKQFNSKIKHSVVAV